MNRLRIDGFVRNARMSADGLRLVFTLVHHHARSQVFFDCRMDVTTLRLSDEAVKGNKRISVTAKATWPTDHLVWVVYEVREE